MKKPMKSYKTINSVILITLLCGLVSSCSKSGGYVKSEGMIWNTVYHITYKGDTDLQDSIFYIFDKVGKSLSVFDKNSLVTQLNTSDKIIADEFLIAVYDRSKEINEKSGGYFDPTVSPLIDAWGFGKGHTVTKDTLAIDSILNFIGIQKTHRTGEWIVKEDVRTKFNFSAIAKGYGCDAVGAMFKRNGVENFMVEIGGELSLSGKSPKGKKWNIAIDAPVEGKNPGEETSMVLSLTDVGVATSGNYRNFREEGGVKTAHTISPLTGRPVIGEILSATVVAPDCMEADGIATACMAGSVKDAKALLENAGVEALLIMPDTLWATKGFSKFISTASEP